MFSSKDLFKPFKPLGFLERLTRMSQPATFGGNQASVTGFSSSSDIGSITGSPGQQSTRTITPGTGNIRHSFIDNTERTRSPAAGGAFENMLVWAIAGWAAANRVMEWDFILEQTVAGTDRTIKVTYGDLTLIQTTAAFGSPLAMFKGYIWFESGTSIHAYSHIEIDTDIHHTADHISNGVIANNNFQVQVANTTAGSTWTLLGTAIELESAP